MPRDDWAKARAKEAARKGRNGNSSRTVTNTKRKKSRKINRKKAQILADRLQSWDTKLWFGRYTGKKLSECPEWYLRSLSGMIPTTQNMTLIVEFLKNNLEFGSTVPVPRRGDEAPVSTQKPAH